MARNAGNNEGPVYTVIYDVTAGDGTGVTESHANPQGVDLIITGCAFIVSTPSTGACTVDIGVAADATTSNDGLYDGLSVATAGAFGSGVSNGTNGKGCQAWDSGKYLNVAEATGDITGLVGKLYVQYVYA